MKNLIFILFFSNLFCFGQQRICYGSIKNYSVDLNENSGNGTIGSTYIWSVNTNFQGSIVSNSTSGNQITIDWKDTPAGIYQLKVQETSNFGCVSNSTITIQIDPVPIVDLTDAVVCLNAANQWNYSPTLNTNLNSSFYTFEWYYNNSLLPNTTSSIIPTQLGTYKVIVTAINSGCKSEDSANVSSASQIIASANVSEDFDSNQTIVVEATGGAQPYFYSLNGGEPQTNNVFHIDTGGKYLITVTDQSTCNSVEVCVCIFMYDKFFTPNGDGLNDTWNIKVPDKTKVMKISIFDRFGKLIKTYNPLKDRWDGTYNGEKLFSTDYWFVVDYENCFNEFKQFKSHFTLKR